MAVISKGIKLSYKTTNNFVDLTNLQEIPDLGGETEAIEITTLADAAHVYTNGIKNYGDALAFKFLYEAGQYATLNTLAGKGEATEWKVTLPGEGGAACTFSGSCSVKLDGVGVNAALTYTLSIRPSTEMVWA